MKQSNHSIEEISAWLADKHKGEISDLFSLKGGFWSSAFAYRVDSQDYVLRLSDMAEGFAIDAAAMRFKGPDLPIPTVIDTGQTLGFNYAISERHYGRFIEDTPAKEGEAVGRTLARLLAALRSVKISAADRVNWYEPDGSEAITWHQWLLGGLADHPDSHTSGWKAKLSANYPDINDLFKRCEARIHELLPAVPERRDLIHGDLLHQNVLVSEDVSEVTAVFSWKCSALGDFLYDVSWCTFWQDWHPGIAAADIWNRTLAAPDLNTADLENAPLRHHCYELQIGASHLGWNIWTDNEEDLIAVSRVLERTLEKGPLSILQI